MAYSTITDILFDLPKKEVVNLTNDENRLFEQINFDNANDDVVKRVNQAIEDADNEINGYLRSRYSVPLIAPVPKLVTKISKDIAIYNLFCRRFKIDIPFREVYLSRVAELKLIQGGQMHLDVDASLDSVGIYITNKTNDDRLFSKSELDKY